MSNTRHQMTAVAALEKLKAGNARFVAGNMAHPAQSSARRVDLKTNGQQPCAVVLEDDNPSRQRIVDALGQFRPRAVARHLDRLGRRDVDPRSPGT